jgi:hypothetical protein
MNNDRDHVYKVWNKETGKIKRSRDVSFDDDGGNETVWNTVIRNRQLRFWIRSRVSREGFLPPRSFLSLRLTSVIIKTLELSFWGDEHTAKRRKGEAGEKLRDAEDENTPNAALIQFLAVLSFLMAPPVEWTCNRLPFTAKFKKAKYNVLKAPSVWALYFAFLNFAVNGRRLQVHSTGGAMRKDRTARNWMRAAFGVFSSSTSRSFSPASPFRRLAVCSSSWTPSTLLLQA